MTGASVHLPFAGPKTSEEPNSARRAAQPSRSGDDSAVMPKHRWSVAARLTSATVAFLEANGVSPFDSAAWLEACVAAEPDRRYAFASLHAANDEIVALYPFASQQRVGARILTWAAQDWADYCGPTGSEAFWTALDPAAALTALQEAVAASGLSPDAICLRKHPATVRQLPNPYFSSRGATPESDSGHLFRLSDDWSTLLNDKCSRRARQLLRRKRRKLEREGAVTFVRLTNSGIAEAWAATMIAWKRRQVRARGGMDHFANPAGQAVIQNTLRRGFGELDALLLDGKPIAISHYIDRTTDRGRTRLLYQTALDPDGPVAHSPGQLLLLESMAAAKADGCTAFDFGMGDESYKAQWTDETTPLSSLYRAFTWRGLPVTFVDRASARLRRFVKARRPLNDTIRAIRAR